MHIILRADSGFANDALMAWCEANCVDYVFGLARNIPPQAVFVEPLAEAKRPYASPRASRRVCSAT